MMMISRAWAMPNHNTCSIKPINELVMKYHSMSKLVIDPFARDCKIAHITNDLNKSHCCTFNLYAHDFLKLPEVTDSDLVIFDPPYSLRQVKEVYDNYGSGFTHKDSQNAIRFTIERDIISNNQKPGNRVISFGWSSTCMGKKRGYDIEEILLVSHGAAHNDTIITVEAKK